VDPDRLAIRGEHVGEFVYGTTAVLIAMAGVEVVGGTAPDAVAAIVLASSVAVWLTHAYAGYLGAVIDHGGVRPTRHEVGAAFVRSSPIVLAAIPAVVLLGGASLGLWPVGSAVTVINVTAVAVLALAGWIGAWATGASPVRAVAWAAATASIGVGIVGLELLLH
jgi:hypothetical protein